MKTTRQLILDHLGSKQVASAREISRALKVTPANVRHHLAVLASEGVVAIVGVRPASQRGRPTSLYALTSQSTRNNLDRLASALLDEIAQPQRAATQAEILPSIARRLAGRTGDTPASLTKRLYQSVHRLNELNYRARWEARSAAPHIILGHCPYAAILSAHPELCCLDALLLENLLDCPVEKVAHLAKDERGLTYCMFSVLNE